jgi:hypothetical protein
LQRFQRQIQVRRYLVIYDNNGYFQIRRALN